MYYYEIPYRNSDGEDVIIHDSDHGNPSLHVCPHAHDVQVPRAADENSYLSPPRELRSDERDYYDNYKKQQ